MSFVSDVALIGTGVAPLIAASHLLAAGKSVLLLNPDPDFFLEDSELPLDPLLNGALTPERLARSRPEEALKEIERFFPGAIERWPLPPGLGQPHNFYNARAPHVRSRARLWSPMTEALDETYVDASDLGLNPQILEDLQANLKFPGMSSRAAVAAVAHRDAHSDPMRGASTMPVARARALMASRLADVDVSRYRNGVLEFIRERVGSAGVICDASPIELIPEGVRFRSQGMARTARARSTLVFWTPRLSGWVLAQAKRPKREEIVLPRPLGVRLWEQWSILSRDEVDPAVVGIWEGRLVVWADGEGAPGTRQLAVLRSGPLVSLDALQGPQLGASWASSDSFDLLVSFCNEFLHWEKCTVRGMKPRAIFEWEPSTATLAPLTNRESHSEDSVLVVPKCDGPLRDVVETARLACDRVLNDWAGERSGEIQRS